MRFLKERESIRIYSITSWEKVNKFVIKNKVMQFLLLLWYGISCHANLLNWISFLLLFFSLSLYSYPIIFLLLGISLASYLILRSFYLVKKNSVNSLGISTDKADGDSENISPRRSDHYFFKENPQKINNPKKSISSLMINVHNLKCK